MKKKDNIQTSVDEIYNITPKKNYSTNKITYNQFDEILSIGLAEFSDYKVSNNKGYRYIFIIIEIFSKDLWASPLKNKNNQTIPKEFWNILTKSKRKPPKIESNRGVEFYNKTFQFFLEN